MGPNGVRIEQQVANRYAKTFTNESIQLNWQTGTMMLDAVNAAATFPIIFAGGNVIPIPTDSILMGVCFSMNWFTAGADERAAVALVVTSPGGIASFSLLGNSNVVYQDMLRCKAGTAPGSLIKRNPGFVYPSPFVKFIKGGSVLQLFGTKNPNIDYTCTATVWYIPQPDFLKFMRDAIG